MSRGITVSKVRTVKSFFFLSIKFWLDFLTLINQVDMVLQNKKRFLISSYNKKLNYVVTCYILCEQLGLEWIV